MCKAVCSSVYLNVRRHSIRHRKIMMYACDDIFNILTYNPPMPSLPLKRIWRQVDAMSFLEYMLIYDRLEFDEQL